MSFKTFTIYLYNSTGEFLEEFASYTSLEKAHNLYRGAVYDALRGGNRIKRRGLIVSKTKYDVFPVDTLPAVEGLQQQRISTIVEVKVPTTVLSEEQLRQKHDMFFMVMTYVNKIPAGKFVEEGQMLRELGLYGKPRYRDAIGRPELKDNKGKVDGTIYYGNQESIKKLKNEGVLQ